MVSWASEVSGPAREAHEADSGGGGGTASGDREPESDSMPSGSGGMGGMGGGAAAHLIGPNRSTAVPGRTPLMNVLEGLGQNDAGLAPDEGGGGVQDNEQEAAESVAAADTEVRPPVDEYDGGTASGLAREPESDQRYDGGGGGGGLRSAPWNNARTAAARTAHSDRAAQLSSGPCGG